MDKIQLFKKWVLNYYGVAWHTLFNSTLWEAVEQYKKETGIDIPMFWD